jgi:metallo-beta-lactamase class B
MYDESLQYSTPLKRHYSMLLRLFLVSLVFTGSLFAENHPEWTQPFPPYRIIGNVYYVGSKDLASFLITTPQGHILIN